MRGARELVERFFAPETVAIVGASERQHHTRALMDCLAAGGIGGERVLLVSPTSPLVHGIATVPTLSALAVKPSLVVSLVPARFVESVVREAGELGVRAVVSIADGFADAGDEGRALQESLVATALEHDVALLGPNTLGYLAPGYGVGAWVGDWSAMGLPPLRDGAISIVAQSSGMLNILLQLAAHRRIGIRAAVSVGNEAVVDAAEFVGAFAEDPDTAVLGLVLESTTRPRALVSALLAARRAGKRVLVLKFGSSEIGRRNALSHSGRLASAGRVWQALFDKLGIGVARDFDEFVDGLSLTAKLAAARYEGVGDLAFLTVSGGDVGLVSDLCEEIGVPLAPLTDATRERLLGVEGNVTHAASNPLDLGLIGHRVEVLAGLADAVLGDPTVGFVGSRLALPWGFSERAVALYETLQRRAAEHGKPLVVVTRGAEPLEAGWYEFFADNGIAFLTGYGSGLRTLKVVLELFRRPGNFAEWSPDGLPERVEVGEDDELLDWTEAQELLRSWGVPHVAAALAGDEEEAARAAARLGYPVCVKGLVPGVVHKSDAGLVHVGLADEVALRAACREIAASPASRGAPLRFEVQQMVQIATELILGMVRDPIMGPVVTLGAGGTAVEHLGDVALALPPLGDDEVLHDLRRLRVGRALFDDQKVSAAQRAGLVELVRAFAAGAAAEPRVAQVDLNPVVLTGDGSIVALDAVVSGRETGGS